MVSPTYEKLDHDVTSVAYYSAFILIPSNGYFLKPGRWPFVWPNYVSLEVEFNSANLNKVDLRK